MKSERVSSVWQSFHAICDIVTLENLPDAAAKYV
jgi:predicted ABC-type transport system involved in lysophospholipase L1 biosynthesis ATPase subunit